jgi:predicted DCC family thiol-disulfide oxidoreductase YuxK
MSIFLNCESDAILFFFSFFQFSSVQYSTVVGKVVRQLQQKWQQREVLLLLAQVLTARGVALQHQFRWLAGNQRQQSSNGTHETRAR